MATKNARIDAKSACPPSAKAERWPPVSENANRHSRAAPRVRFVRPKDGTRSWSRAPHREARRPLHRADLCPKTSRRCSAPGSSAISRLEDRFICIEAKRSGGCIRNIRYLPRTIAWPAFPVRATAENMPAGEFRQQRPSNSPPGNSRDLLPSRYRLPAWTARVLAGASGGAGASPPPALPVVVGPSRIQVPTTRGPALPTTSRYSASTSTAPAAAAAHPSATVRRIACRASARTP